MENIISTLDTIAEYALWAILVYHISDHLWDKYQEKKHKTAEQ